MVQIAKNKIIIKTQLKGKLVAFCTPSVQSTHRMKYLGTYSWGFIRSWHSSNEFQDSPNRTHFALMDMLNIMSLLHISEKV